uniref:X8 domain-containing protein n=1 Tax=Ananas comosus var. bracteatus TaxID=296719 RepID=A0A6V7Q8X5_ANACO|nr:unnamed protein product [Ananas comosus var. bracteatus]
MARTPLLLFLLLLLLQRHLYAVESAIGVNWGMLSSHRIPPSIVVDLMRENRIAKVKLFDSDPGILRALVGSGIEVMVGIPNEMLSTLASSQAASDVWVAQNVSRYLVKGGVNIRYIAVGNEPFLTSYAGQFQSYVLPAMLNLQQSLAKANLAGYVKLIVPCNADAYQSASLPSQGTFRPELTQIMTQLVSFLNSNGSPFLVNIYPFLSLYQNSDFPQDYAFFDGSSHPVVDGSNVYYNAFDGNYDTLVAALNKIGYGSMPIAIGEVGWPTDGAASANITAARAFNQVFLMKSKRVYFLELRKALGIFSFDGQAKYPLNLGLGSGELKNAKNVQYLPPRWCVANPYRDLDGVGNHLKLACSMADCTTLYYGGSCNAIGDKGNISYAFNSYYQLQKQDSRSCDFDGLGMITYLDPSVGDCRFLVGINDSSCSSIGCGIFCGLWIMTFWVFMYLKVLGSL